MKILAINGSYRGKNGHTGFLIERLFTGARLAGAEFESVILARKKILRCLSCDRCHTSESYLECVQHEKDDVAAIFEAITNADLLIYATPVYILGLSGLMKIILDRMYSTSNVHDLRISKSGLFFHHVDAAICSKPFVTLVCCDNLETKTNRSVVSYFRTYACFMDAPQVGELVRNGGRISNYRRDVDRIEAWPRLAEIYSAYEQAGQELARDGHIHPATQRLANQEMIPIPFFGLLKNIPAFNKVMVVKAREILS